MRRKLRQKFQETVLVGDQNFRLLVVLIVMVQLWSAEEFIGSVYGLQTHARGLYKMGVGDKNGASKGSSLHHDRKQDNGMEILGKKEVTGARV